MITLTKIFRFESAHAIHGYPGACANIHGHSYELHVSVTDNRGSENFIDGMGIAMDFKDLKTIVQTSVIYKLDHALILSQAYLASIPSVPWEKLITFEYEPTAENLLIFIRNEITESLPEHIQLTALRLWETRDSYAEWSAG
ncbi:MAG: 6-carboxytetrahydropterin synthase [Cyclobacteriaceae bacterium]|jgi:6-pyruvoyltetrahydropterin/6-carboxytetrahydropterin synthase|nr:MAG: 6-carboxytetrahydropterin synthase [Cyclobacteriaceae bacterium]